MTTKIVKYLKEKTEYETHDIVIALYINNYDVDMTLRTLKSWYGGFVAKQEYITPYQTAIEIHKAHFREEVSKRCV